MKRWILLLLCIISLPLQAAWYKTIGSAAIINNDEEYARQQAIQDALRQAMLKAGASVSSIESLSNGALTRDDFQIRANSEVRQYQLLDEEIRDERIFVHVRSYIVADRSGCSGGLYAKNISLIRFNWQHKDDARYGQIYDLNKAITRALFERLGQQRQIFVTHNWLDNNLGVEPGKLHQGDSAFAQQIRSLAEQTNSQYMLFGSITDASIQKPEQGILDNVFPGTWFRNPLRHFTLQLYLYDGLTGQLLEQPFYQTQAHWTFDREAVVDPASQDFWQSSYGLEITATLNRINEELKGRLQCERPTARIIRVDGLDYHINLGKTNGLKVGDRFHILHKADFTDTDGQEHPLRNAASGTMEVSKVYAENAVLRPLSQYAPGNIQVNDLAELE
ncbi:flagella assembly protein FlgT [Tolumonas lignilytica]|uniref:flagella assembly protein FlgT n=1 Tax=Tolumonas lignilytica TaxID=1283284 RepID=UPI000464A35E|nr:flagella assembly protein FlgT [Tolumonas lignilytica]